jgi:pre-mRNA cleavage complex 2 protein Pcf11
MEGHLDMHFRQNRKANQNIGRGHSRSWFTGVEDWIHDVSMDLKGKGRADGSRPLNAKAAAAAEMAKREAELRALYVVVPSGDEAKLMSCPICKETSKSEFLEDIEDDWVWKNAIKKDDRVYHATCHAEAVASTNSLAARLRTEMANYSRSGTPEAPSSRSTPPKYSTASGLKVELRKSKSQSPSPESSTNGTKRKVSENDTALNAEADGTPPLKKMAL